MSDYPAQHVARRRVEGFLLVILKDDEHGAITLDRDLMKNATNAELGVLFNRYFGKKFEKSFVVVGSSGD